MATLYFVDGYHGGIRGHMPEGSWQDILSAMERWPEWKISLEIEPESWEYLRRSDLGTYRRLQRFVSAPESAGRVEFISGSYAQPFCWAVNGESNIRQLLWGREMIRRHFPGVCIDTYAVQEPCFTSALPQILLQMGYRRMSLKNPTAWGGYMAKMPGEILWLKGPDGSAIPTVPRYECEELISCNATDGSGYDYELIGKFADKCAAGGIAAPAGMCLQDLGWSSAPLVRDIDVEYVTWREYFERFGDRIRGEVSFSQDDVRVSLPWGNRIFGDMLRKVRRTENKILQAEKLLAMAWTENPDAGKRFMQSKDMLDMAWKLLMQAQHHDGYICATCGEGDRQWGYRSGKLALTAAELLDEVMAAAQEEITGKEEAASGGSSEIWLRVANTVGSRRSAQAQVSLGLEPGVRDMRVLAPAGNEVPSQYQVTRSYADGGIGAVNLRFAADMEGIGYQSFRVETLSESGPAGKGIASKGIQNVIEVRTDCLHLVFDLAKGGSLVRFLHRQTGRDYAAGVQGMGSLRGYSIKEEAFIGNGDVPAECEILENGPLCCKLRFKGSFHGIGFTQTVTVREGDPCADFEVKVHFEKKTDVGFPYEPGEEERFLGTRRSSCREDYKMGIQLPQAGGRVRLWKSAAFDVCESKFTDTRFDSWETIKHNVINGYVDLYQEDSDTGLAVFCDRLNGYSLVDNRFALTCAFGYHGNFWWGYQPAEGDYTLSYSLMPHAGNWEAGAVAFADSCLREPLLVQRLAQRPERMKRTLLCAEGASVEVVTLLTDGDACYARLFHPGSREQALKLGGDLAERIRGCVDLEKEAVERPADRMGGFEIRTLCITAHGQPGK
ncbi:MAG: hypothetical protein HFH93_05300 [Lachnospiraceae bacterium]|nr:hypothetical protein [Lachnospiraceae bacterium]